MPDARVGDPASAAPTPAERPLIILGTGGNSRGALDAALAANRAGMARWEVVGFLDDCASTGPAQVHGFPVLGPIAQAARFPHAWFVNGIGSVESFRARPKIVTRAGVPRERFATVVHPRASVSALARVGVGCILLANSTICLETVLGDHVIVLENSVVNHNATVGDHTLIASSCAVSGYVTVERGSYIGSGSVIRQQVRIGKGAVVGMGAVVLHDVPAGAVMVGNPARALRERALVQR
jgi:sugar O-acyltransferase (sialic acid O-acetyltransferase NeuD family)